MLHIPVSHVNVNIPFYYVRGASYILGVFAAGISTTTCRKAYVLVKYETGICFNSMQAIYYIIIYVILAVIGGYKFGVINNRPFITGN